MLYKSFELLWIIYKSFGKIYFVGELMSGIVGFINNQKDKQKITKQMIENVAKSYSNGEVEVIENIADYSFKVKFVGSKGIPDNMADLTLTINEIKPAHLSFCFEYTYNTWNDIADMTWDEASVYTWEQLRVR